jgi:hypothetical protein
MPGANLSYTAGWNVVPAVEAGPDQSVTLAEATDSTPDGVSFSAWTGDATSGLDSRYTYTAAQGFGNSSVISSVTVNGVDLSNNYDTSGSGWSVTESVTANSYSGGNLTGESKNLAIDRIYFSAPITVTFTGLTVGRRYQATFFSVGLSDNWANWTFDIAGGDSLVVNQNEYKTNNGIKISCDYTATGTTQEITITPDGRTFTIHALVNRNKKTIQATASLDGTVNDVDGNINGDSPTITWSTFSGPGAVEFADPTAADTTATFATEGSYVLRLTADDGYTSVSDEVTITVSLSSPPSATYTAWASETFTNPFNDTGLSSDPDGDGRNNLWEFAFGTDPTSSQLGSLAADGSAHGAPIPVTDDGGATFDFLFVRRDDHGTSGSLSYTVQFSSDLETYYDSGDTPSFVADSSADADYEVVKLPFPATLPNGQKATFARVMVVESP